jgi:transposase
MGKTYRPYLPEQDLLLPPSLRDWLPEGHLAYFVSDLIDELNLSAIESYYEQEERGYPPYHPRMMTKILVYGYCVGVFSSRRLQKRLHEDVAFRVLAADNQPDFRTLSDFRKIHLATLHGLFEQVLRMALELGALKLGRIAIDGSKIKGNASKHKAMSYKRMKEDQKRLKQEVRRLLKEAERIDAEEDARYGRNRYGDELPAELQRREQRLQRIREAKRALEARARQEAEAAAEEPDGEGSKTEVKPEEKDQYNFTDPESRILKGPDGFLQGYNAQIAVEPVLQLIVGRHQALGKNSGNRHVQIGQLQLGLQRLLEKISDLTLRRGATNVQRVPRDLARPAFRAQKGCPNLGAIAMRKHDPVTGADQADDLGRGPLSICALFGDRSLFARANQGVSANGKEHGLHKQPASL